MTMLPADCAATQPHADATGFEKLLRIVSVITMFMTVPQVLSIWVGRNAAGVSTLSWSAYLVSACLWFVHGVRKGDKTIYLSCIGWILLDAAVIAGTVVHG